MTLDGAQLPGEATGGNPVLRDAHAPGHLRGDRRGGRRPHALARGRRAVRGPPELPAIHYAITGLGGPVRVAPYVRFGSAGLAEAAVAALDGRSAVILRNHGAVTYGRDLAQAYDRAVLLEWLARTYRLALSYGEPAILSAAELDEVTAESRRRRYGERRAARVSTPGPALDRTARGSRAPRPAGPRLTVSVGLPAVLAELGPDGGAQGPQEGSAAVRM